MSDIKREELKSKIILLIADWEMSGFPKDHAALYCGLDKLLSEYDTPEGQTEYAQTNA